MSQHPPLPAEASPDGGESDPAGSARATCRGGGPLAVLIIDGHPLFSTALRMALRAEGIDAYQIPVADPTTIVVAARGLPAGLVLLDLSLRVELAGQWVDPAELVAPLRGQGKQVVVLSGGYAEPSAAAAIAAGAIGTLPRTISFESLLRTLAAAAAGHPIMTDADRRIWLSRHRDQQQRLWLLDDRLRRLSLREQQVLGLLADGHRAATIAERFGVPLTTVRTQIRAILTTLEVNSQLEAVALFVHPLVLDGHTPEDPRTGPVPPMTTKPGPGRSAGEPARGPTRARRPPPGSGTAGPPRSSGCTRGEAAR